MARWRSAWALWAGLRGYDIDAAKVQRLLPFGAVAPADIGSTATNSVATIVCVVDDRQTRDVLLGPHGLAVRFQPGHVVVLCPTIALQDVQDIAEKLSRHGADTIDAPMSGGPARARVTVP